MAERWAPAAPLPRTSGGQLDGKAVTDTQPRQVQPADAPAVCHFAGAGTWQPLAGTWLPCLAGRGTGLLCLAVTGTWLPCPAGTRQGTARPARAGLDRVWAVVAAGPACVFFTLAEAALMVMTRPAATARPAPMRTACRSLCRSWRRTYVRKSMPVPFLCGCGVVTCGSRALAVSGRYRRAAGFSGVLGHRRRGPRCEPALTNRPGSETTAKPRLRHPGCDMRPKG